MNDTQSAHTQTDVAPIARDKISLIEWLVALARRKKMVLGLPFVFATCAALVSLAIPNSYKANTKVLPSRQIHSAAAATINQLGGFAGTTIGAYQITIPVELYVSMLKSTTVADNLIHRFDLKKVYGTTSIEETRYTLAQNSRITWGKDSLILIEVEDRQAKRAAEIANGYVDALLVVARRMALTEASHRRQFYERALQITKVKLSEAEIALRHVADNRGPKAPHGPNRTTIETAARLGAQISATEVRLGAMQAFVMINNQEYIRGQQDLGAMNAELKRLKANNPALRGLGNRGEQQTADYDIDPALRIMHDAKYYGALYDLLMQQYEAAQLDEAKDSNIIQALDEAVEPEASFKPKRGLIVVSAALFGLLLAIIGVLLLDVVQLGRRPGEAEQFQKLMSYLGLRS